MSKITKKQIEANKARVDRAYRAKCCGIPVPIMELSKIQRIGLEAIAEGVDDETLAQRIFDYVQTIAE